MTKRLVFYSVVTAIGALRLVMKLTVSNAKKQKKHKLLKLSNVLYGLPTVSAILGLVMGSFFADISILKCRYINLLTWIGILFLISAFSLTDSSFMFLWLLVDLGLDLIINSKKSEENSFFLNNYNKLTKLVL